VDVSAAESRKGYIYATLAYLGWGFFPMYWKLLLSVPAIEILSHRILWGFLFYFSFLAVRTRKLGLFIPETKREIILLLMGSVILGTNWFVYVFAVNSGQIIESSLGYFINPLVNILIGVVFLKEHLSRKQKIAALLATVGVLVITYDKGTLPWIAIFLALSFSMYGLTKRQVTMSGEKSNLFETSILLPFAIAFQIYWSLNGHSPVISSDFSMNGYLLLLLAGGGIITGLPLIFFAEAANRIPFYMLGFFQFLAPSLQFLTGVVVFKEPLSSTTFVGFVFIWVAGSVVIINNILNNRGRIK
jgi:chloramphenicol-sensitive protein RarD